MFRFALLGFAFLASALLATANGEEYNVALNGIATSSTVLDDRFPPSYAINEEKDETDQYFDMFRSELETGPWWKLELDGPYDISQVKLYSRMNSMRLGGLEVLVKYKGEEVFRYLFNDNVDMTYDHFPWENIIELGGIIRADEVIVKLPDTKTNYLKLQEVEVMGIHPFLRQREVVYNSYEYEQ